MMDVAAIVALMNPPKLSTPEGQLVSKERAVPPKINTFVIDDTTIARLVGAHRGGQDAEQQDEAGEPDRQVDQLR